MPRPCGRGRTAQHSRYRGIVAAADDHVDDLVDFIQACPSSYHTAMEVARRLRQRDFAIQAETEAWDTSPGGHVLIREGAVMAWRIPNGADGLTPFRMIGSHTDSPAFKLKPKPDLSGSGYSQLGVEVYGGPLLNSWLDRELGVAGRLVTENGVTLVQSESIARIPQLALHLDRGVNDEGLKLDKQRHTAPLWAVGDQQGSVLDHLADLVGLAAADILGFDLTIFDTAPPVIFGTASEFLASRRLDNLVSVHAGLTALINAADGQAIPLLAAFDHEEIGSESRSGASGPLLADVVARISRSLGGDDDQRARALARSACLSADAGHAVHPNYPERHDPANRPMLNGGPLLKINSNQRYATGAQSSALWWRACRRAGVATQEFVSNNTVPCGSTIGPLTATRMGVQTVDVGIPLLAMHSARELAGVADPPALAQAMEAFLGLEDTP
ncbi:MAG: putative family aminopeptidase [Propionibacteriaceae bacterium]|nr:putative family aminopeptidase [Propionibacteriaceae bacterium]